MCSTSNPKLAVAEPAKLFTAENPFQSPYDLLKFTQGSYRKLCVDFQTLPGKKLLIFPTFQGDFCLHLHQGNTLKSTFHDKISSTSGGAGRISLFMIVLQKHLSTKWKLNGSLVQQLGNSCLQEVSTGRAEG